MQAPQQSSKPRELVPEGNHVARLYEIIYVGEINTNFKDDQGNDKWQEKVRLTWELPNITREFDGEEKPMVISREVTFSLYRSEKQTATLRTIANALIGTPLKDEEAEVFDIDDLLGKTCMLQVIHNEYKGTNYAKAEGFGSIPTGMVVPEQVNKSRVLNVRTATQEEIDALPEFLAKKIQGSKQYHVRFEAPRSNVTNGAEKVYEKHGVEEIGPDDIPF